MPGLRREEVALLAGVSVDYYTQMERGNLGGVSDSVLDALAGALQLDEAERSHGVQQPLHAGPDPLGAAPWPGACRGVGGAGQVEQVARAATIKLAPR